MIIIRLTQKIHSYIMYKETITNYKVKLCLWKVCKMINNSHPLDSIRISNHMRIPRQIYHIKSSEYSQT